jgi:hypothetical protein
MYVNSLDELVTKTEKTELEKTLLQCIAVLSTHPWYKDLDPEKIFELMRGFGSRLEW